MRITIVTINRNGERFLAKAMQSVLEQRHDDLEYLVIDGASTDGSLKIIRDFAARDARLYWQSAADRGIADAMNKGIDLATGEIVGFLHSDDCYPDPGVLAAVADAFAAAPAAEWLTGGADFINAAGKCFQSFPARSYDFRRLVRANLLFHPATFVRTAALRRHHFDAGLRFAMDYDLWLRLGEAGAPVVMPQVLACFRVHPESCSIGAADEVLVEEFAIRRRYLRRHGRCLWPYYLDFLVKRRMHRRFTAKLIAAADHG